jgi:hypothetical protein
MNVNAFRPIKKRRTVKLDELGHVVSQMQGLLDTDPDPENADVLAFYGLVRQWHAMLQSALVEESKR